MPTAYCGCVACNPFGLSRVGREDRTMSDNTSARLSLTIQNGSLVVAAQANAKVEN